MKTLSRSIFLLISSLSIAQNYTVTKGTLKVYNDFRSEFVDNRTVAVWLPDGYNKNQKYAVLYLNNGQMLFDANRTWNKQSWEVDEVFGKLLSEKKIKDCIVVGVWNNGDYRHSEYFPEKMIKDIPEKTRKIVVEEQLMKKPRADNYLIFLSSELKPWIDKNFSTRTISDTTFIGGSSMGGLLSLYAICEYPNIFGGAICMSTHLPMTKNEKLAMVVESDLASKFRDYLQLHLPNPENHKIYMDYGDQTLDQYYKFFQEKVDVVLKAKRFTSKNWTTKFFPGDDHSEKSWSARLQIPVEFMLKR